MWLKSLILFMTIFLMTFLTIGNSLCEDTGFKSKDLIGIWKPDLPEEGFSKVLKFSNDGTYRIAWSVEKLDTRPVDKGQVRFEGEQVTFVPSGSPTCKTNTGRYSIKMTEKGNFQLTVNDDPCYERRADFVPEWTRVKP